MIEEGTPEHNFLETTDFYLGRAKQYLDSFTQDINKCDIEASLISFRNLNFYSEKAKQWANQLSAMGEEDIGKNKWHEAHNLEEKSVDFAIGKGMKCECKPKE